jgi:hypothetical protein
VEFNSANPSRVKQVTCLLEMMTIPSCQENEGRVMVSWSTERIGVFSSSMAELDGLLREWEIAASDTVEPGFRAGHLRVG